MSNQNKKIYIMLSFTGTALSRVVKTVTMREYSHVSISLDKEFNSLYSFGRTRPRNPLSGGFVKEEINTGTYKIFKNTKCTVYSLEVTDEQHKKLSKIIDSFLINKDSFRFNVVGLLGPIINVPMNREFHYFCSQFVSKALYEAGIYDFGKDFGLVKPLEFETIPNMTKVYKGKLSEYPKTFYRK